MDKTLVSVVGAVTALAASGPAQAAVAGPANLDAVMQVASYADLVKPIPNAVALLKASDAAEESRAAEALDGAQVEKAQFYYHHHHHHHHRYWRRFYHHHHHHHRYFRRFHHHHHHGYY
ncbi:hypothetical protein [Methylobacterium sp. JK268]